MTEVKRINIEDFELDGEPYDFDVYTNDYDLGQFGHNYEYYLIQDLAYWDALVCFDAAQDLVVAITSQVIDENEATEIILRHKNEGTIATA